MDKSKRDALVKRINRVLSKRGEKLVINRTHGAHVIDVNTLAAVKTNIDLVVYGTELNVLTAAVAA